MPVLLVAAACGSSPRPTAAPKTAAAPPVAATRPVTTTYHGVDVVDPYRWLEDDADPEVRAWSDGQNAYARAQLDALPNLPAVRSQLQDIALAPHASYWGMQVRGPRLFAFEHEPPREQAVLVAFDDGLGLSARREVLDPASLGDDRTLTLDWYEPSPDGALIAVSMSRQGSERGDLRVFDAATGKPLPDAIEHVTNGTAGGDLAWLPDGSGFYYTRYPRPGERPEADEMFYQQLWLHRLGQPVTADEYVLGKDLPRIAEIRFDVRTDTGELLVTVQNGDGGDFAHYLRAPGGAVTALSSFGDGIKAAFFGRTPGELFLLSRKDAPRGQIVRVRGDERAVVVPEGKDSIDWDFWFDHGIVVTDGRLYVRYQLGGPTAVRAFLHDGTPAPAIEQLDVAAVGKVVAIGGDDVLFHQEAYLTPEGWYVYRAAAGTTTRLDALSTPAIVDMSDVTVVREYAVSKDGTKVPVSIIARTDHPRDGSRPCVVSGYGGYGINIEPGYAPRLRVLFDRHTCYAEVNTRGGGELGEVWHRDGMLTRKQNVFDDFAAALQHLIDRGYTASDRLGIVGGSNGGLLMGAIVTQHPGLVRAVASAVGIYDMLRVETEPNGQFNVTEFGTVADEAQFRAMHAYSPYHRVEDGAAYPAVLMTTGANDPRVASWQSRKMTARLQAATSSGRPILLRTSASAGHGAASLTDSIDEAAHRWAFLLHHIGAE